MDETVQLLISEGKLRRRRLQETETTETQTDLYDVCKELYDIYSGVSAWQQFQLATKLPGDSSITKLDKTSFCSYTQRASSTQSQGYYFFLNLFVFFFVWVFENINK